MVDRKQDIHTSTQADGLSLTILIVDDDADMRAYIKQCLRFLGSQLIQVLEAADGMEAMSLARRIAVDLVISDVIMPRMDGYELSRALKAWQEPIKVLLISGESSEQRDSQAGVDAFLGKPFNAERLQACINHLFC